MRSASVDGLPERSRESSTYVPRDSGAVPEWRLVVVGELRAAAVREPKVDRALDQAALLELVQQPEQRPVLLVVPAQLVAKFGLMGTFP
jgi:hypothetical protein